MNKQEILRLTKSFLDNGYSKAELARQLEISRSSLIKFLNTPSTPLSKATLGKMQRNLEWLERSQGREIIESLSFLNFRDWNATQKFKELGKMSVDVPGFEVGYHGLLWGGPGGFAFFESPGISSMTSMINDIGENSDVSIGRTETGFISDVLRTKGNHDIGVEFYNKHPEARFYLKVFRTMNFSSVGDMTAIKEVLDRKKFKETIYCLEGGLMSGEWDYFVLVIGKDENSYLDFLVGEEGIYSAIGHNPYVESKTLIVAPKIPTMLTNDKNLSYLPDQQIPKYW